MNHAPETVQQMGSESLSKPVVAAAIAEVRDTILALDLGTATGWALRRPDGVILSGTASFKPSRYEGAGMRFLRFAQWLDSMGLPEAVYFEEVRRHRGVDAAHCYGGLLATLTAWCEARSIPYAGIPVGTIKASTTGKGNASKEAMIAAIQAKGFAPADDNEADALAILFCATASTSTADSPASCARARDNVRNSLHSLSPKDPTHDQAQ